MSVEYNITPDADLYHDRLDVSIDAPVKQVRSAGKEAMSDYHPDQSNIDDTGPWENIQKARETLSDDRERSEYKIFVNNISDPGVATELFESWKRKGKPISPEEWIERSAETSHTDGESDSSAGDDITPENTLEPEGSDGGESDMGGWKESIGDSFDSDQQGGDGSTPSPVENTTESSYWGDRTVDAKSNSIAGLTNTILSVLESTSIGYSDTPNYFVGVFQSLPIDEQEGEKISKGFKISLIGAISTVCVGVLVIISGLIPYLAFGADNAITALIIPLGSLVIMPMGSLSVISFLLVLGYCLVVLPVKMVSNSVGG